MSVSIERSLENVDIVPGLPSCFSGEWNHSIVQLKGLAIIGVLVFHLQDWRIGVRPYSLMELVSWCVYAFIFCSGYLHGLKTPDEPPFAFIGKRARRLLIPFVLIGTIMCALRQLLEHFHLIDYRARYPASFAGKWVGHLLLRDPMIAYPLYFFVLLFFVSTIFTLLIWLPYLSERPWIVLIASAMIVLGIELQNEWLPRVGFSPAMLPIGVFQYSLGYCRGRGVITTARNRRLLIGMLALGVGWYCLRHSTDLLIMAAPAFLFAVLQQLRSTGIEFWTLSFLGKRSATIFAYHAPFVIHTLIYLFYKWHLNNAFNYLLSLSLTLVICSCWHEVLHRYRWLKPLRI